MSDLGTLYLQKKTQGVTWSECVNALFNSFSPGDALIRLLQIKYTLIRQLLQELSDQGTLYLLMHDPRINIFPRIKTKMIEIGRLILTV